MCNFHGKRAKCAALTLGVFGLLAVEDSTSLTLRGVQPHVSNSFTNDQESPDYQLYEYDGDLDDLLSELPSFVQTEKEKMYMKALQETRKNSDPPTDGYVSFPNPRKENRFRKWAVKLGKKVKGMFAKKTKSSTPAPPRYADLYISPPRNFVKNPPFDMGDGDTGNSGKEPIYATVKWSPKTSKGKQTYTYTKPPEGQYFGTFQPVDDEEDGEGTPTPPPPPPVPAITYTSSLATPSTAQTSIFHEPPPIKLAPIKPARSYQHQMQ